MYDFLRDYQVECHTGIIDEFKTVDSTLAVMPTGTGKTVLAAGVIKTFSPRRSLFIAHRDTLIYQAKETIEQYANVRCDIEMAGSKAEADLFMRAGCVLTTVQTQLAGKNGDRRMHRFNPEDFDLLIVDEAHHYASKGWKQVLDYYRKNPKLKVLGITATPDRADEAALGQIFQTVAFDYEIQDAVHDGWLIYPQQLYTKVQGLDYSAVKVTAGDLNGGDLARVMEVETIAQGMVGSAIEIAKDRQFVFFCVSIAQAEMVSNIFNRHRSGMCEWMCEDTPKESRRQILRRYDAGEIQGLANVGVLTEGWDSRGVSVCFMGRPTKSRSLCAQMAGRILRPLKGVVDGVPTAELRKAAIAASGKPSALVVDYVENSKRHVLVCTADILGGKYSEEAITRAKNKAEASDEPVRMDQLLDLCEDEIRAEKEKKRQEEEARKAKLVAKVKYRTESIDPFDVMGLKPVRDREWDRGKQLSEAQLKLLSKQGINADQMPYGQAKQLLNEMFRRWHAQECSFGQAKILRKRGYPTKVTQLEASAIIDIVAHEEGWKARPPKA